MQFNLCEGYSSPDLECAATFGNGRSGQAAYQVIGDDFSGVVEGRLYNFDWQPIDSFGSRAGMSGMRFFAFGPNMRFRFRCTRGAVHIALGG